MSATTRRQWGTSAGGRRTRRTATSGRGGWRFLALAVATAVSGGGTAVAQTAVPVPSDLPDSGFRPTRGVFVPGGARAGDADATAVELNPAQLGLLSGGAAALVGNLWKADAAMPGRGGALFLAAPLWGAGGLGLGLQGVAASGAGALSTHGKFQLGYGVGGRAFAIGATWGHLFGGGVGGTDTFDVGASWRSFSRVALAVVAEDVTRPHLPAATGDLPRRWVGELALRPLATDRLELAAAALHLGGDSWSALAWRFRLATRLAGGWRLFGDVEAAPRRAGALPAGTETGNDWRAAAGLAIDFDHASLVLAGRRSFTPDGAGGERWGGSAAWHAHSDRTLSPAGAAKVVRVTISGSIDSDREFLNLSLRLRALAGDPTVAAVLLRIESLDLGMGRIEELRDLVAYTRLRGKGVVAYLTQASTLQLYLASACDRIVMHPAGDVSFAGLSQVVTFYKGAMDRLGVAVDLVRIAEYKGAMEPFIMTGQSAPVRENRTALLDDKFQRVVQEIAADRTAVLASSAPAPGGATAVRALTPARVQELLGVGSFSPGEARDAGLLDALADDVEIEELLRRWLGRPSLSVEEPDSAAPRPVRWSRPRVAVILVDGNITEGTSRGLPFDLGGVAGADSLVDALDDVRRDPGVRAVVLRVNSPGGSAFASDVIARAVARVRGAGKPVVASMGDVAASGGYYVSAPANVIFAEPSTTTGSIGVFGFKLDVSRLLAALSINVEVTRRGPHADALGPHRAWTPEERATAERRIRHLYGLFTATVVEGRKSRGLSSVERVDAVGRGAVWTGAQARGHGLVDQFGGVIAAIDHAATLGRIPRLLDEPVEVQVLPRPSKSLLGALTGMAGAAPEQKSPPLTPALRAAARLAAPYLYGPAEGFEARLPYDVDVR